MTHFVGIVSIMFCLYIVVTTDVTAALSFLLSAQTFVTIKEQ